jgi:hypothetical protein
MLMEVVDPEPLTGDHVPFRKETGKSVFMEGVTASVTLMDTDLRTTGTSAPADFLPPEKAFSD